MPRYQVMLLALDVIKLLFVTAVGACVGSLINVLVYRLPLGISVVTPPSRCPSCQTKLTWRENIPIFGWILLRGRCRFCKAKISPEYPIVEAVVAALFAAFFALWYLTPMPAVWLGIDWGAIKPEWALNGEGRTWPAFVVLITLVASLVAMTLVDAKTTTIPLVLAWTPALVAVVVYPLHALWVQFKLPHGLRYMAAHEVWMVPTPGPFNWGLVGAVVGAVVGLGVGNALLSKGLIRRSFEDYDEWERSVAAQRAAEEAQTAEEAGAAGAAGEPPNGTAALGAPDSVEASAATSTQAAPLPDIPKDAEPLPPLTEAAEVHTPVIPPSAEPGPSVAASGAGVESKPVGTTSHNAGPIESAALEVISASEPDALIPGPEGQPASGLPALAPLTARPEDMWIQYPYARREMVKELIFLAPCLGLGALGMLAARHWAHQQSDFGPAGLITTASLELPLWLRVLAGVLLGYLVGGGIVWGTRIIGSLAAGREAMGLGDVHLMGAVGACLGWIDAVLIFFGAAFVGIIWQGLGRVFSGVFRRAMPYGPCLAVATLLLLLLKPLVEIGLSRLMHRPIDLP